MEATIHSKDQTPQHMPLYEKNNHTKNKTPPDEGINFKNYIQTKCTQKNDPTAAKPKVNQKVSPRQQQKTHCDSAEAPDQSICVKTASLNVCGVSGSQIPKLGNVL